MNHLSRFVCSALILLLCAVPGQAQQTSQNNSADDLEEVEDIIVVTASRTEQPLHEVPAAMTVLTAKDLERIPADDYGDFLRNVPGLNVSQMSARDIQITGRQATSSLSTSELVLLDGRTLYLDFFGFVMWDYVPLDPKEIKQIEIIRGPGSAVWGANAMSGVINLITKRPKEMQGTSITLGAGDFNTTSASITHAGVSGKLGYKFSASYFKQDPYDRPTGVIPGTKGPANPGGTSYPAFENKGTEQPKGNFSFDYDQNVETNWTFGGGWAATDGIMHSGIGPFDIASGAAMSYVKADWNHGAARATFFVNDLDGDATNLLSVGVDGRPINFAFASQTYNFDFSNTSIAGNSNIFTYGATARRNNFDLSIAPAGDKRDEYGVFIQDEILLGDKARWLIGARWDDIDPIGSVVSPRTSFLVSPSPNHTFRASFNRAFRAPSMINNFLDITILNQLGPVAPGLPPGIPINPNDILAGLVAAGLVPPGVPCEFVLNTCDLFFYSIFPSRAVGNPLATEEKLDAFEVGYVGTFGPTTFTISAYRNETTDSIDFYTSGAYTSLNPPPNWPLSFLDPPIPIFPPQLNGLLPSEFSYRNIGEVIDKGVEVSLNFQPSIEWSVFMNYSYQQEPEATGIDQVTLPNGTVRDSINTPPENRANLGVSYSGPRFFTNWNVNYADEAFWTDVLDSRFWGPTDSYTQLNASAGVHFGGDRITISVTAQNLNNETVQQHIFGDLIDQKITGQAIFRF